MGVNQTYTRMVKMLRVILPLLALVSVISLVVWPILNQEHVPEEIPSPTDDQKPVGVADDASQVINPEFSGLDTKNRAYVITADTVYQGSSKEADMTLINPMAKLELSPQHFVSLKADKGVYRPSQENLTLDGTVTLGDSTGYRLITDAIDVDLKNSTARSQSQVTGEGPIGTVNAKGLTITTDRSPFVTFDGPVQLVIYPEAKQ